MIERDNQDEGLTVSPNDSKPIVRRSGGSFCISWGKYGGWYWRNKFTKRLCLGWLAITFIPMDLDDILTKDDVAISS